MSKVSIIIPARAEKQENLERTLNSIWANATGDYEVIVGFNGEPTYKISDDFYEPRYKEIVFPENVGIKTNINVLAAMATGKYIYKSDAHCSFGKGFDECLH